MRRRLLMVLLTFAAVTVTGFAWPLLSSTAAERTQRLLLDRTATLDRFAVLAQQAVATGDLAPRSVSAGSATVTNAGADDQVRPWALRV